MAKPLSASSRRAFISRATALGLSSSLCAPAMFSATRARIRRVVRREETVKRYDLSGDNWNMTWAADGRQYAGLCDGYGWLEQPTREHYNSHLIAIDGGPLTMTFADVPGYPDILVPLDYEKATLYYGFGILALDGFIYQFLTCFGNGVKLIYSPDNGKTWHNQDGTTPVVCEPAERQSRRSMVFYKEPQGAFNLISVLQMGRNYQANRDGFVYVYAPNGNTPGTINELVMLRVPRKRILDRTSYEYFAGSRNGRPRWTRDIDARAVVYTFPPGLTGKSRYSWHPSLTYNAPLGLYMMASWGWDLGAQEDGRPSKASYLGFWIAPDPWGPWTQIHEETAWLPAGDAGAQAYQPQIAPKWIAADGQSFWLVWTDLQAGNAAPDEKLLATVDAMKKKRAQTPLTTEDWTRLATAFRRDQPYYSINVQRVDLLTA